MQGSARAIDADVVRVHEKLALPALLHLRSEIRSARKAVATANDCGERRVESRRDQQTNGLLSPSQNGALELGSGDLQIDLGLGAEGDAATGTGEIDDAGSSVDPATRAIELFGSDVTVRIGASPRATTRSSCRVTRCAGWLPTTRIASPGCGATGGQRRKGRRSSRNSGAGCRS